MIQVLRHYIIKSAYHSIQGSILAQQDLTKHLLNKCGRGTLSTESN